MSDRLYMAVHVDRRTEHHGGQLEPWERELLGLDVQASEPEGWRAYALERWGTHPAEGEVWPNGHKPFFFPKTNVPYKSRSTAQRRVDMINAWGGNAEVLVCEPVWESVAAANARRAEARLQKRIDAKRAELDALVDERDLARLRALLT